MRFTLSPALVICVVATIANGARLPQHRAYDPVLLEGLVPRDVFYVDEYPVLLRRHHYAVIDEALAKRAPANNVPGVGTGAGTSSLGDKKTMQPTMGTQAFGQQKMQQNAMPDAYGKKGNQNQPNQIVSPKTNVSTKGVAGADYYNKQNPTVQSQLRQSCDVSIHSENTGQEQLLFTQPSLNTQTNTQVFDNLSKQCYRYQDKVEPQFSDKTCGYFDAKKTQPKCSGEFTGGRIPGTSGSSSVYSASCEINKVSSPKYFGTISDNERNKLITNVNGDHGKFTSQFLHSQNAAPYKGGQKFCQNVPPP